MADVAQKVITVFYSYASSTRDDGLRAQLEKHLAGLQRSGLIESWSRREIVAGKEQQQEIDRHLENASVILLLISPDFVASDYCYGDEMLRAIERHQAENARVIPILLRPVYLENEPFTHLATLPRNGKPVSMWRNRDAAFADVTRDISASIKELQSSSSTVTTIREKPVYFTHNGLTYFTPLANYLASEGREFQEDTEQGKLYIPKKEYFAKIEKALDTKHRAILTGRAAAGKTGLALALAKYLQEQAGYSVGYKDVKHAEGGDGRIWYTLAKEHDRAGMLYILDNCHLAPREVDEFCSQWQERPPTYAQCLLVSRTGQMEAEDNTYLHTFADDDRIEVRAENIFLQVIEQYISSLQTQAVRYTELLRSDDLTLLEKQHGHNLVISRDRLEAWAALGPEHLLSEVRQEDLYRVLNTKYLSSYGTALAKLCTLQRYEISAHTSYVEKQLAHDEITRLLQEKLLTSAIVTGYGKLYDLTLHPTEARELFIAYVFTQYGGVTQENINPLVTSVLTEYLSAKPLNYLSVYDSLARQRHDDILKQLLTNRNLQEITASQFTKERIVDAIRYVYKVAKVDREHASLLLAQLLRVADIRSISTKLLQSPFENIARLLDFLKYVSLRLAQQVVDMLDIPALARCADAESTQNLFRLLQVLRAISPTQMHLVLTTIPPGVLVAKTTARNFQGMMNQLHAYDYSHEHLQAFVEALDMQKFALQSERISLQSLFWTLHQLNKASSSQAQRLLRHIPLWMLSMRASTSNIGSVDQLMQLMVSLGYTNEEMREFVLELDVEQIAQEARATNLRRIAAFLRTVKTVAPTALGSLLEVLTAPSVASLIHAQPAGLNDLEQLRKAVPKAFWESFLHHCLPEDIAAIFQHTRLGLIGTFLHYQYNFRSVREAYALFQEQFLQERLATTSLEEIGEFLDRTQSLRQNGKSLASKAIGLFLNMDITDRVAHTDLLQYALLLHHTRSIASSYLPSLLAPLRQGDVLQTALAGSDIHGIQLLIFNIASIDKDYLLYLQQALTISNITEKLEEVPLRDIGLFLWNTYQYLDKALAQMYCDYLDEQPRTQPYSYTPFEDVCFFLWNLASISNARTLRTFDDPTMLQYLHEVWVQDRSWGFVLKGIAATIDSSYSHEKDELFLQDQQDFLISWFTTSNAGRNPYYVALALQGLRTQSDEMARVFVQSSLPVAFLYDLLVSARESAITPRSIRLMEETISWLRSVLEGY